MLGKIISFLTSGALRSITDPLISAYRMRLNAETQEKVLEANETIARLEAHYALAKEDQRRLLTAWIRPAFASIVLVFWAKLVIWDTVLQWGVTPYPGDHVMWFATVIPAAYFVVRPFERR